MGPECARCGRSIVDPDDADSCLGEHPERDEYRPMLLHATCPCPVHGWESQRGFYVREDRADSTHSNAGSVDEILDELDEGAE